MGRVRKKKSISTIFACYSMLFCAIMIGIVLATGMLYLIFMQLDIVLPANYYQNYIAEKSDEIKENKDVEKIIPEGCRYVIYDLDGTMVEGNISEEEAIKIWSIYKANSNIDGKYHFTAIIREKDICIVEYELKSQFANSTLQKYVPYAESWPLIIDIILFIIVIIIFSKIFSRRFAREMRILKETTVQIQIEDLDFKIKDSPIIEIDEIISALSKMKNQLQQSLNKQWQVEKMQNEQISALAHDIKTPLTIVKGNAELLNELELSAEQQQFVQNILNESARMEFYIKTLMDVMKTKKEITLNAREINTELFIDKIIEFAHSIVSQKNIEFMQNIKDIPQKITVDEELLHRAIVNIISNAVEYTPENGKILFTIQSNIEYLQFSVEDSGRGFNDEEIKYATEQFFQGDKSRNSKMHYGMGLYIAKRFIEMHKGQLILDNSKELGGAKVSLKIPLKHFTN